ncbi:cysteine desulfurase family protein [Epilithonimonas sp. UC225_85]|uniref:cysteine desulfurase family protein n=1 Tax=Epilithonimonas sp. UC225_85 TaxID=3350167 RepID=UPI0036D40848
MSTSQNYIYLDNASTTKVDDEVIREIIPYLSELYGNSSSAHSLGVEINKKIVKARGNVAKLFNSEPKEITFTSGATEAINTTLKGIVTSNRTKRIQIITVKTEHSAVLDTCKYLEEIGFDVVYLPVLKSGLLDLNELKKVISEKTLLVSVMLVNNETGVIQPIKEITKIAHQFGALMMTDATQAVGKIPVDVKDLNIDYLVFSGHKFYAPKGIGGYYQNSQSLNFQPLLHGGGQEKGKRSGTLNVPGVIGLGKSCEITINETERNKSSVQELRDLLENELLTIEGAFVNGDRENRIYNISNICFPHIDADILIKMLDNICVSNGSACHSELIEPSHVLTAMGLSNKNAFSSIRFSLSKYNTESEILYTIKKVKEIISQLKTSNYA